MTVSVIIPTYNYANYLKEALDSVLSQDYPDFEIILIDDGSTDETPAIGKAYAAKYPQVQYRRNPTNLGIFLAVDIGMQAANGQYYQLFSSDDRYHPGLLSKSMEVLLNNPSLEFVCSDVGYFQDGTDKIESTPLLEDCHETKIIPAEDLAKTCRRGFRVAGASCVFKKELLTKYGGFDSKLENLGDWFLFHKIAFSEGVGYIPEVLISMRVHSQTLTNQVKRNKKRRRATYHHLLKILLEDKNLARSFLEAGLLDFIFRDLKWKLYLNPKYMCYWGQKTTQKRKTL